MAYWQGGGQRVVAPLWRFLEGAKSLKRVSKNACISTSYPGSLLDAHQLLGGRPWSRGHLNYFVLGEGWSKETRFIWLISVFEFSIHSPAILISLLSLQQRVFKRNSAGFACTSYFWGSMLLPFHLPTGYVKLLIFHLLRWLFTQKMNTFMKEFLLKRWTYWLLLSSLWILWLLHDHIRDRF